MVSCDIYSAKYICLFAQEYDMYFAVFCLKVEDKNAETPSRLSQEAPEILVEQAEGTWL